MIIVLIAIIFGNSIRSFLLEYEVKQMKQIFYVLLIVVMIFGTVGCTEEVFDGEVSSGPATFTLDYNEFNSTKSHNMALSSGDTLHIKLSNKSGKIAIAVNDDSGNEIYNGYELTNGEFQLSITKDSTYTIKVVGSGAKGSTVFEKR